MFLATCPKECGLKLKSRGYACLCLWFHLPRFHFGTFFEPKIGPPKLKHDYFVVRGIPTYRRMWYPKTQFPTSKASGSAFGPTTSQQTRLFRDKLDLYLEETGWGVKLPPFWSLCCAALEFRRHLGGRHILPRNAAKARAK